MGHEFRPHDIVRVVVPNTSVGWQGILVDWDDIGITIIAGENLMFFPWASGVFVAKSVDMEEED